MLQKQFCSEVTEDAGNMLDSFLGLPLYPGMKNHLESYVHQLAQPLDLFSSKGGGRFICTEKYCIHVSFED